MGAISAEYEKAKTLVIMVMRTTPKMIGSRHTIANPSMISAGKRAEGSRPGSISKVMATNTMAAARVINLENPKGPPQPPRWEVMTPRGGARKAGGTAG